MSDSMGGKKQSNSFSSVMTLWFEVEVYLFVSVRGGQKIQLCYLLNYRHFWSNMTPIQAKWFKSPGELFFFFFF